MNLQAREIKKRKTGRSGSGKRKSGFGLLAVMHIFILGAILFFIVNYRVSLTDDIASLNRKASTLKRDIHQYNRELEHLKLKREALTSWVHVRTKIRHYKLALVSPEPSQVKQVVINKDRNSRDKDKTTLVVSQN